MGVKVSICTQSTIHIKRDSYKKRSIPVVSTYLCVSASSPVTNPAMLALTPNTHTYHHFPPRAHLDKHAQSPGRARAGVFAVLDAASGHIDILVRYDLRRTMYFPLCRAPWPSLTETLQSYKPYYIHSIGLLYKDVVVSNLSSNFALLAPFP